MPIQTNNEPKNAKKPCFLARITPNTLTCCNLMSGCIAVVAAIGFDLRLSLLFVVIGAVFDFFDGMSARLLHVSSPIGKELDSLADVVTFGVAPSMMLFSELSCLQYPAGVAFLQGVVPFFAFVMAAFSALRLAKFNLDERQTTSFIGLPTPANALFWGSLLIGGREWIEPSNVSFVVLVALMLLSCYLLIAEIPMFALKFKVWGWKENQLKYSFLLVSIPILALLQVAGFAVVIALYVLVSLFSGRRTA